MKRRKERKMNNYRLNNGVEIPVLGFGTWKAAVDGEEAYQAVLAALKAGYWHIDTAAIYQNEESVGRAIKDSGLKREDFVYYHQTLEYSSHL